MYLCTNPCRYNTLPGDEGHFSIGLGGDFSSESCWEAYEAKAGDFQNRKAHAKLGGNVFFASESAKGKNKKIGLTKTNALTIAPGFCERAGLQKLLGVASLPQQLVTIVKNVLEDARSV